MPEEKPSKNTISSNRRKFTSEELTEIAVDQLARLLWKSWLYMKKKEREEKMTKLQKQRKSNEGISS